MRKEERDIKNGIIHDYRFAIKRSLTAGAVIEEQMSNFLRKHPQLRESRTIILVRKVLNMEFIHRLLHQTVVMYETLASGYLLN